MRQQSWHIALCALLAALGTVLMAVGGLIPIATYTTPLFAALLLLPVLQEFGPRWAGMVWLVTALLALMVSADREAAALYWVLGWYPILKPRVDALGPLALPAKAALFTLAQCVEYALLIWVFQLQQVLQEWGTYTQAITVLMIASLTAVLLIWDALLGRMRRFYIHRIRPKLPRMWEQRR